MLGWKPGYTFPFYLPNSAKNWKFKTMKKRLADIILHKCTKNHDNMLHCSWDMACVGCNSYFPFWAVFSPFTPLRTQKKINKNEKKTPGGINIYHKCTKNHDHTLFVPEIWYLTDVIVSFHFGLSFSLLSP